MYTPDSTQSPCSYFIYLQNSAASVVATPIQLIKEIFHAAVDSLLFIWYTILYSIYQVDALIPSAEKSIFPEGFLCTTHNYAKWKDLSSYIAYRRHPIKVVEEVVEKVKSVGLKPRGESFYPEPFGGHCYGNVIYFIERWKETDDIFSLIEEFSGGSPLTGALYQAAYETLFMPIIDPELVSMMHELIEQYPAIDLDAVRDKWAASFADETQFILEGTVDFLKQGGHPEEGGLLDFIGAKAHEENKIFTGKTLCSVREVALAFEKQDLNEKARIECILDGANLAVEKLCLLNGQPDAIQKQLNHLEAGSYMLNLPRCGSDGEIIGSHSVALIVTDQTGYIYDPNFGIAEIGGSQIPEACSRLIGYYTGLQNYRLPPNSTWYANFLACKPNPTSDLFMPHFELIKITSALSEDSSEKN